VTTPVGILMVDDNRLLAEAMERRIALEPGMRWLGWAGEPGQAADRARRSLPDVVMLDIDMPGSDSFEVLRELVKAVPQAKVVMLSGYVKMDYIDRAIESGAWGYLSKNESMEDLFASIMKVASGEFVLSPEAEAEYRCQP
jgi:DNA-binding NarL/FixJ family response regulator